MQGKPPLTSKSSCNLTLCQGFHRPWKYIFMGFRLCYGRTLSFEYFQKLPFKRVWILYWAETQVSYRDHQKCPIPNSKAGHTLYDLSVFLTQCFSCTTHFRVRPKFSFIMRSDHGPTNCFRLAVGRSDKSQSAAVRLSRSVPFFFFATAPAREGLTKRLKAWTENISRKYSWSIGGNSVHTSSFYHDRCDREKCQEIM